MVYYGQKDDLLPGKLEHLELDKILETHPSNKNCGGGGRLTSKTSKLVVLALVLIRAFLDRLKAK
jgi:hypothetical protein